MKLSPYWWTPPRLSAKHLLNPFQLFSSYYTVPRYLSVMSFRSAPL